MALSSFWSYRNFILYINNNEKSCVQHVLCNIFHQIQNTTAKLYSLLNKTMFKQTIWKTHNTITNNSKKIIRIFCVCVYVDLYMIYRFVCMLHSTLEFSAIKRIVQVLNLPISYVSMNGKSCVQHVLCHTFHHHSKILQFI